MILLFGSNAFSFSGNNLTAYGLPATDFSPSLSAQWPYPSYTLTSVISG